LTSFKFFIFAFKYILSARSLQLIYTRDDKLHDIIILGIHRAIPVDIGAQYADLRGHTDNIFFEKIGILGIALSISINICKSFKLTALLAKLFLKLMSECGVEYIPASYTSLILGAARFLSRGMAVSPCKPQQ